MARWWHDTIQGHQGDRLRRRLRCSRDRQRARQDQAGQGGACAVLTARLVFDARRGARPAGYQGATAEGWKLGDRTCKRHLDDFKFTFDLEPFVQVQQTIAILAQTAIDLPPMQAPSSFNLEAVKANIDELVKAQKGQ